MSEVQLRPAENFDQAYGMICEGFCPNCGGGLHRRPGWGYGFCIVHDMGWAAFQAELQSIVQYMGGRTYSWISDGSGTCISSDIMELIRTGPLQPWLQPN